MVGKQPLPTETAMTHCTTGADTTHCEPPLEQRPNVIKRPLTTKKLEGGSNTAPQNQPVLVPSRDPQHGLSAPPLLGIVLIIHVLSAQQLNYNSSNTLLQWWNDQNLLAEKWTQESEASKQRAIGHNQLGAVWSDFFKMDLVVSTSFEEEHHV